MAASASPYGLRPANMMGGQPMTHGIRLYKIVAAYGTSIFNGDLVTIGTNGYLEKMTGTTSGGAIGVFLGVEYEDDSMGLLHRQMWTASTATKTGKPIWGYVMDDPNALFMVQADDTLAQTALGANFALVQGTGNSATGNSAVALDADTLAATATLPLRLVDFVQGPTSAVGDAYTDVIVKINTHLLGAGAAGILGIAN